MEEKPNYADTRLYDMLDKDIESISDYIKTGRQFWVYNYKTDKYDLITVTYRRGNVAFYKKDGTDVENAFFVNSAGACFLYPRNIYVKDLANFMIKRGHFLSYKDSYDYVIRLLKEYTLYVPDGCEIDIIA